MLDLVPDPRQAVIDNAVQRVEVEILRQTFWVQLRAGSKGIVVEVAVP